MFLETGLLRIGHFLNVYQPIEVDTLSSRGIIEIVFLDAS